MAILEDISLLIVFVWTSAGFLESSSISCADTYELLAPESINAPRLIPLTSMRTTGTGPLQFGLLSRQLHVPMAG